ncbi:hypothetical protein V5799_021885, partial [Amblyomma americanum]
RLWSLGFRCPSCIQSVVWPTVTFGRNVVAVAPPHSGKTLAYLIPLMSQVQTDSAYEELCDDVGPLVLVLTSTWKGAQRIYEQVKLLSPKTKGPTCCTLYAAGSECGKERVSTDAKLALCPNLKAFGHCEGQKHCSFRHQILPQVDHSPLWHDLPSVGTVRIKIIKVMSASHFYARILQHWEPGLADGDKVEVRNLEETVLNLGSYLTQPGNCKRLEEKAVPMPGQVFALQCTADHFQRVLVTSVAPGDRAPARVTVTHMDFGGQSTVAANKLIPLPPKLSQVRPQAVEVYCCGIKPPDGDVSWSFQADFRVHSLFFKKELVGKLQSSKREMESGPEPTTLQQDPACLSQAEETEKCEEPERQMQKVSEGKELLQEHRQSRMKKQSTKTKLQAALKSSMPLLDSQFKTASRRKQPEEARCRCGSEKSVDDMTSATCLFAIALPMVLRAVFAITEDTCDAGGGTMVSHFLHGPDAAKLMESMRKFYCLVYYSKNSTLGTEMPCLCARASLIEAPGEHAKYSYQFSTNKSNL